jgi:phosphonate transport system substrate-binding protein
MQNGDDDVGNDYYMEIPITMKNVCSFCLVLAALLLAACGESESVVRVDMEEREEVVFRTPEEEITYAYLPQYSHRVSYKRHHLMVDYLNTSTDLAVRQIFPDTFQEHMNLIGRGQSDINFTNPFVYVKIAEQYGARAFARVVEEHGRDFRGQIIVRADDPRINTLDDVRGKSWIAVDPSSAGGYLFGLGHFLEHGIKPKDFAQIAFAPGPGGKQEKVVLAVLAGQYDVGTIREGTLEVLKDKIDRDQIRVLAETRWYPGWVFSARKGLDPEVIDTIKAAMTDLLWRDPEQHRILKFARIQNIVPATDSDFDPIRELIRKIDAELEG